MVSHVSFENRDHSKTKHLKLGSVDILTKDKQQKFEQKAGKQ
jgi:hypothetical protein